MQSGQMFVDYEEDKWYDENGLLEHLQNYDVISFDVFDTLLFRKVDKPTDVFICVEKQTSCKGFSKKRKEAERRAREKKQKDTGNNEVTLQEIYQALPVENNSNKSELMNAELQVERSVCYANCVLKRVVDTLIKRGQTVIAVSDMYLPKNEIQQLLSQNGYTALTDIYVSCEYGASKSDGNLYKVIWNKVGRKKTICHIGDNFYSDVFMAHKNTMNKTIYYIYKMV